MPIGHSVTLASAPFWSLGFLLMAFNTASTDQNVRRSFRDAGLVPYSPDSVRSVKTSVSAYPAPASESPKLSKTSLTKSTVFAGTVRDPQLRSLRYSRMTESQKDQAWEYIRKIEHIFESCTGSGGSSGRG